jgi:uncharacterized protein YdeI (YjbR/CyaY-like superfamily)
MNEGRFPMSSPSHAHVVANEGANPRELMARMGHDNLRAAMIYLHSSADRQRAAAVPDDLQRALDQDEAAAAFFATLDRANRYAILYRIHEAKKPETRAQRVTKFVAMLHSGETLHPARKAKRTGG